MAETSADSTLAHQGPAHEEFGPEGVAGPVFLSFCIPTYNRAEKLDRLLGDLTAIIGASAFRDEVEVVVSDNASTDATGEVVRRARESLGRVCRVSYHRQPHNVGMMGNFQFVYEHARGDYVWINGDDDLLRADEFDALIRDLREHAPEVCISSFTNWNNNQADRTALAPGEQVEVVTDFNRAVELIAVLGKISQYVYRRHAMTPHEKAVSDRGRDETMFWFATLSVMLMITRATKLLLRAGSVGWSDNESWNLRFSPRVYGTFRDAVLVALEGHPTYDHFARTLPVAPVDNIVVGYLFRNTIGRSKLDLDVVRTDYAYVRENLWSVAFSSWRNLVKLPFILALLPTVTRVRYGDRL